MVTFFKWYQGLIHAIPFITTVGDLYLTDLALEKSHWWISFITLFPSYMVFNWYGAMTYGSLANPPVIGQVYGVETWATNVPLSIFLFFLAAWVQAGLFYGTAVLIDKIWPKRAAEEFDK